MRPLRYAIPLVAAVLFVLFAPPPASAPPEPLCDVTCEPNPGSGTYSNTIKVRAESYNARGSSVAIYKAAAHSTSHSQAETLAGSESYNYAVPILSLPGRNGLDLNLTLYYNSRVWTIDKVNNTATFNADRDFPGYGFRLGFGYIEGPFTDDFGTTYLLTEPDGGKRELRQRGTSTIFDSSDGSYVTWAPDNNHRLFRKDGSWWEYQQVGTSTLYRPVKLRDTNGNFITISYVAGEDQEIDTITDTLGRTVKFNYDAGGKLNYINDGIPIFGKVYAVFTWGTTNLNYSFTGLTPSDTDPTGTQINVLTSCRYNNSGGPGYVFVYGDWGIVTKIEQRAAGFPGNLRSYVRYNYPTAATQLNDHPTFSEQWVWKAPDATETKTLTYGVTKSGGLVTSMTITDAGGTATTTNLYTSGWQTGLPSTVTISKGGPLRTVAYAWQQITFSPFPASPHITSVTTTLNDSGQQSKVEFSYASFGNVSELREFDFGASSPTRKTQIDYLHNDPTVGGPYLNNNILDRPKEVRVRDTAGALKSKTVFEYDNPGAITVSISPQYGWTSPGVRGNLTAITRYENAATNGGPVTRSFTYDSAGNLRTAQLDCCQQRQWDFTSNTQYAYPTTITTGPPGAQLSVFRTYNGTGQVTSATDENGKTTIFSYDYLDRLWHVQRPDNQAIETQFDDISAQPNITTISPIAGGADGEATELVQVTTSDGLGRPLKQETRNAVGGTVFSVVDTEYDNLGRVFRVSNPHTGSPQHWTEYAYDDLGRVRFVTPPGSQGFYQYDYSGNVTTVTDPAGKQRRTYTDALGRLTRVDEPGPAAATPGSGWVQIDGGPGSVELPLGCDDIYEPCFTWYDSGSVWITVNGMTKSTGYGQNSTSNSVATALRNAINADSGYPVIAGGTGGMITLTAKTTGSGTNYSLSAGSLSSYPQYFSPPSFSATPSGSTLTGGYDAGAISLATPYVTTYLYDPLDNLTQVIQGAQTRTFQYDSMSRLKQATTPEAGTVQYSYTSFSQVQTRTDARGVVTTYGYDNLNRLKTVSYSVPSGVAATPTVSLFYGDEPGQGGQPANAMGRLKRMTDGTGSEVYTYHATMPWITQVTKTIDGTAYVTGYQYNFAGEITSMTYPSGRVVTNSYDSIGRLTQVSSGGINYLHSAQYNAAHQPTSFGYGNGVTANFSYNARMQLQTLSYAQFVFPAFNPHLNLTYNYAHPNGGNNGQITRITDNLDNGRTVNYTYDEWSRLKTAQSTGSAGYPQWAMNFVYDRYGNRSQQNGTAGGAPSMQTVVNANSNRVTQMNGVAVQHDVSGNLTQDDINTYSYDGENRMIQSPPGSPFPAILNAYDGAGLRVKRVSNGGSSTTRVIFSGTKEIAHYVNSTAPGLPTYEFIYAGSQLIAVTGGTAQAPWQRYLHQDHLSPRVITNETGGLARVSGHYPFGEMWYEQIGGTPLKFTTYHRDPETGLDYALFRFHAPRLGRFQTPDPVAGSISNPQSLNGFAYVVNDPVNLIDPLGLFEEGEEPPPPPTPYCDYWDCWGPIWDWWRDQNLQPFGDGGGAPGAPGGLQAPQPERCDEDYDQTCEYRWKQCKDQAEAKLDECLDDVKLTSAACHIGCHGACIPYGYGYFVCLQACRRACSLGAVVAKGGCYGAYGARLLGCDINYQLCVYARGRFPQPL